MQTKRPRNERTSTKAVFIAAAAASLLALPAGSAALDLDVDVDVDSRIDVSTRKVFNQEHRATVRRYLHQRTDDCPEGMESRDDMCTPIQPERMWLIGKPLPLKIQIVPLPPALAETLPSPGAGNDYGFVNGDIVLYRKDTRTVIDAVVWSS
ncbi:MAG TPA: hypothetical protein VEC57_02290 [Candidatus Limnocylindrales bacterium]|nr:hypothetical protein [Candidatus Limnocylindrales bacterium]